MRLITAVLATVALIATELLHDGRDQSRILEQRLYEARKELVGQVVPQFRSLIDLTTSLGADIKLHGVADSSLIDSLRREVEPLMVSNEGTGERVARAFTDSLSINYSMTVFVADTLFHELVILRRAADTVRMKASAMGVLRESVWEHLTRTARLAVRVENAMVAEQ